MSREIESYATNNEAYVTIFRTPGGEEKWIGRAESSDHPWPTRRVESMSLMGIFESRVAQRERLMCKSVVGGEARRRVQRG